MIIFATKYFMDTKTKEFYESLKEKLELERAWPNEYLFKFIVPADESKIARIERSFDDMNAVINFRDSSKGTFTSVSIKVHMISAQAIVDKYIELSTIEGLLSF